MKPILLFLMLVTFATGAWAQGNSKISGTVIDSLAQKPVEFANVALAAAGSDTPIDGTVCDENGTFSLARVAPGKYKVMITFIGFKTTTLNLTVGEREDIKLGNVIISRTPQVLEAVVVEGEKALIEERVDRTVYNAENDVTARGGDATDVLKRVPMLSVDLDGNVSLRGNQNILVLINNKPSSIMASSVADALKQIPADEIKTVEVITSPSARYDAEGSSGIINIITKKNTFHGLTLNINSGVGLRGSNLGLNGNYRIGKMGFSLGGFGRSNYNVNGSFQNEQLTRAFNPDGSVQETLNIQEATTRNSGIFGNYNLGWDYDIDKKNSLAASVRFGIRNNRTFQDGILTQRFVDNTLVSTSLADNENKGGFNNIDASFNYTHFYDKPQREFSFQSMFSRNNGNTLFENFVLDPSSGMTTSKFLNDNDSYNQEITLQADYQTPVSTNQIFEVGGKNIMRKVISDYTSFQAVGEGAYEPAVTRGFNNNLNYSQNITAGYMAYTLSMTGGYSVKAGARYEYTTISAFTGTEENIEIPSYGVLVPSVNLSKKVKNGNTLKASYNRRIQRPSMRYLNPNIQRSNSLDVTVGNPELSPEYTNNFELGYSTLLKGVMLNLTSFARFTNDGIQSVRVPDVIEGESVLKTTYENIGVENAYGTSLFLNANVGKLSINGGGDVYYSYMNNRNPVDSLRASNGGIVFGGRFFGNYNFNKGWGAQFFSFYRGRQVQLQGTQGGFYMYSLGFVKQFNEKRGSVGLAAENFLQKSVNIRTKIESPLLIQNSLNTRNTLGFRITFSYRLGKMSMDARPRRKRSINNDDLKDDGGGGDGGMQMSDNSGSGSTRQSGAANRAPGVTPQQQRPSSVQTPAPADSVLFEPSGTWTYSVDSPQGGKGTLVLNINDHTRTGTIKNERMREETPLENIVVKGNNVTFSYPVNFGGNAFSIQVEIVIGKDDLKGVMTMGGGRTFNIAGTRNP